MQSMDSSTSMNVGTDISWLRRTSYTYNHDTTMRSFLICLLSSSLFSSVSESLVVPVVLTSLAVSRVHRHCSRLSRYQELRLRLYRQPWSPFCISVSLLPNA